MQDNNHHNNSLHPLQPVHSLEVHLPVEIQKDAIRATMKGDLKDLKSLVHRFCPDSPLPLFHVQNSNQQNLVYIAAAEGQPAILNYLLDLGADPNVQESVGSTPLHGACWYGFKTCVEILLSRGARTDIKNKYGDTPQDDAIRREHHEIAAIFDTIGTSQDPAQQLRLPSREMMLAQSEKIRLERVGACLQAPDVKIGTSGKKLRVVCISDTHDHLHDLAKLRVPDGDVLVHCGDFTNRGLQEEWTRFIEFMRSLPHKYKIIICGNHDYGVDKMTRQEIQSKVFPDFIYLQDSSYTIDGVKFYGTPWSGHFMAFSIGKQDSEKMYAKFNEIPDDADVVLSHIPPHNILDLAWLRTPPDQGVCPICHNEHRSYLHWGSVALRQRMLTVQPKVHIFGHVHGTCCPVPQ